MRDYMTTQYLIEYVYYYPVPEMQPHNVTSLTTDYTGMVNVGMVEQSALQQITFSGSNIGFNITPQAYVSWYNNNLSAINSSANASQFKTMYNALTSPLNGYSSQIAYTDYYLQTEGYSFVPYSSASQYQTSSSPPINPVTSYGLTTNNLYAMILTSGGQAVTGGTNIVTGQKAPTTTTITSTIASQIANTDTNTADNNQQINIQTPSQIAQQTTGGQAVTEIATTANNTASNIGKTLSQNELPILFVVGAVAVSIMAIAVIVVFK